MAPPEVAVAKPAAVGHPSIHSFVETEYFDKIAKFSKPLNGAAEDNSVRCESIGNALLVLRNAGQRLVGSS
jgi:hypothetical protein